MEFVYKILRVNNRKKLQNIKISIPHAWILRYQDGNRIMDVEVDFREPVIGFGKSYITNWKPPYSNEIISDEKKDEIYRNILNFLYEKYSKKDIGLEG